MPIYASADDFRAAQRETFTARMGDELGADPEALLADYRAQVDRVHEAALAVARQKAHMAMLASRFGARGTVSHWDAERKAFLARLAEGQRAELLAAGSKVSEAGLDSFAHAHADYARYLERARVELEQYEEQQAKLSELFAALDHAKGVLAYYEARLQMVRALSYAYSAEARLS